MDPESVLCRSHLEPLAVVVFLHENYLAFVDDDAADNGDNNDEDNVDDQQENKLLDNLVDNIVTTTTTIFKITTFTI